MDMVTGTRAQLLAQLRASGFVRSRPPGDIRDLNANSENWAVVKAALCAGLYPNLARVDREQAVLRTKKECKVSFHHSSTLREMPKNCRTSVAQSLTAAVEGLPTDWIMFEELGRAGRFCHVKTCTLVSPVTVAIFSGPSRLPLESVCEAEVYRTDGLNDPDSDSEVEERLEGHQSTLKIDDWVLFKVDAEAAQLALQLRQKWHSMFLRRMKSPGKPWTSADDAIVKTIVSVLTTEEHALNLSQPPGVGQRPRPCNIDHSRDEDFSPNQNLLLANIEGKSVKKASGNNVGSSPVKSHLGEVNPAKSSSGVVPQDSATPGQPRYFVIKAQSVKAIENSVTKESWTFAPNTERKLNRVLKEGRDVILIFSIQGSGYFQGVAKLVSREGHATACNQMGLQWIKRANISFQATRHLLNPLNENRLVQTSRDGQEIEAGVGAALCSLWDKTSNKAFSGANACDDGQLGGRPIRGFPGHSGYEFQLLQRIHK